MIWGGGETAPLTNTIFRIIFIPNYILHCTLWSRKNEAPLGTEILFLDSTHGEKGLAKAVLGLWGTSVIIFHHFLDFGFVFPVHICHKHIDPCEFGPNHYLPRFVFLNVQLRQ